MNYFEFYEIPISFNPDPNLVKKQFYALSKKYHPDFYINQSEEKQNEALELSTLNNKAYQVLSNAKKLLPYVLELKGVLVEGENYTLPQDFLMEMMDVNETIMDLQFDPDADKLEGVKKEIQSLEKVFADKLSELTKSFDTSNNDVLLAEIKDLYYREKYLFRIKESLGKIPQ